MTPANLKNKLEYANSLILSGQVLQAEQLYATILIERPGELAALSALADLAVQRGDFSRAAQFLDDATRQHPRDFQLKLNYAAVLSKTNQLVKGIEQLESVVASAPTFYAAWLFLGQLLDAKGNRAGALQAWFKAVIGAQRAGQWIDERTTEPQIIDQVIAAIEQVRVGRKELLYSSYQDLRLRYSSKELERVDRALSGYLREWNATPPDARQRPRFFYFPDLPNQPYQDPFLHTWATQLQSSFEVIRNDALRVFAEDTQFRPFLEKRADRPNPEHIKGVGATPSWEAFFFYRHGERFDDNHARCPATSALLESIDLCRISEQAPEICFSVLRPGTEILPHYGVSNVRLVMHLPLVVPEKCALNLIDAGEHSWKEGQLVMFDDTYQHEAWNHSVSPRIVLLMDCWNPHLTPVERVAVKQLVEMITAFQLADRASQAVEAQLTE
jgi:aspartate beta-hydroxylase